VALLFLTFLDGAVVFEEVTRADLEPGFVRSATLVLVLVLVLVPVLRVKIVVADFFLEVLVGTFLEEDTFLSFEVLPLLPLLKLLLAGVVNSLVGDFASLPLLLVSLEFSRAEAGIFMAVLIFHNRWSNRAE